MTRNEKIKLLLAIRDGKVSASQLLGTPEVRYWQQTDNFKETGIWEWNGHRCQATEIATIPAPLAGTLNILAVRSPLPLIEEPDLFATGEDMEKYEGPYNYWP